MKVMFDNITTKVLPGNKIEIEIPEAEIGDSVQYAWVKASTLCQSRFF
ncbi:MAG: hypothetical protein V7L11_28435 [Nostoc sp.]